MGQVEINNYEDLYNVLDQINEKIDWDTFYSKRNICLMVMYIGLMDIMLLLIRQRRKWRLRKCLLISMERRLSLSREFFCHRGYRRRII